MVMRAGTDAWSQATKGMTLQPGDTLKTGSSGKAEITFFEGTTVELDASTELLVSNVAIADSGSTTISLKQQLGKTVSRVKKLTDTDSRFDIETPAAVAAVRGSTMIVAVATNGKTEVSNLHGDIRVIWDNKDYIIHEGMKRTIIPGQPPGPEEPIYAGGGGGGGPAPQLQAKLDVTMLAEPPRVRTGENITYTCILDNIGQLPFHEISVNNDVSGNATYRDGDTNGDAVLDPGETWTFTSVYTLREGDPSPLVATATVSATTATFVTVVETETAATTTLPVPGIALVKAASVSQTHVGDTVAYTYTVTNTGNTPLSNISVADDRLGTIPFLSGDDNANSLLDVAETWLFSANYTIGKDDPDLLANTANVSGTDALSQIVTASANTNVAILRPGIALVKAASVSQAHVGDNITYTYTVTNAGNTPLSNISVADDRLGNIPFTGGDNNTNSLLDVAETWLFSTNYTVGKDDPDLLANTANVSGTDALSQTVIASANTSVAVLRPGIALGKAASVSMAHASDAVTYTYAVTNTGNTPLSNISLADDRLGNIPFRGGDNNANSLLDVAETWLFSANYSIGKDDPDLLANIANVSGADTLSQVVSASASGSVAILRPGIALGKTASVSQARAGDTVTYTYAVTNTGNTPLASVLVDDDRLGSIPFVAGDANGNGQLDQGETWLFRTTYTITRNDTDPLVNTAIVSGTDALNQTVKASDKVSITIKCR